VAIASSHQRYAHLLRLYIDPSFSMAVAIPNKFLEKKASTFAFDNHFSTFNPTIEVDLGFPSPRRVNPPILVEPGVQSAIPVLQLPL